MRYKVRNYIRKMSFFYFFPFLYLFRDIMSFAFVRRFHGMM